MDLILWRHADATTGDDGDDNARKLTGKGRKQANQMAAWLDRHLPDSARIISSPAVRAVETAEALVDRSGRKLVIKKEIGTGADAAALLIAAGWPDSRQPMVLVGHQPSLGRVASFLLFGEEQNLTIRKASVWWLTNRARDEAKEASEAREAYPVVLRAAVCPDFL